MIGKFALVVGVLVVATNAPRALAQSDTSATAASGLPSSGVGQMPTRKSVKAANRKLAKAVRYAVEHQKGLDATRIAIVARNGNVTLDGSVPDASQVDLAGQQARSVVGVSAVVNRLVVGEIAP